MVKETGESWIFTRWTFYSFQRNSKDECHYKDQWYDDASGEGGG